MLKKVAVPFVGLLILLGVWELSSQFTHSLLFILPAPSDIIATLWESSDRLFFHTFVTFKEMIGGFLLALGVAFPLAWAMVRFKTSRLLLQPFFITIQCLPMFTLAPIMVIWFGWGYTAIVIPTALMIFFPLTLNIYQGLRSTPQELLDFFRSNQATSFQTLLKLRLPFATPHIFSGFRISAAIAGIGAVAGEWAGAEHGLGILMLESRRNADLEICFAALFCLTMLSLLLYSIVLGCERWCIPPRKWKIRFVWRRMAPKKRRFAFACFLIGTLLTGLVSCQNKSYHSTRLLLDWLPNPNHVDLYASIDKGYFAEEGIFLKLQKMHDSGSGISYLTSRQADLLLNHMPSIFKACERGAKLKIVGLLVKQPLSGLIYTKTPEIRTSADLTGKILGYCLGGSDTTFLDYLLRDIAPAKKCNVNIDLVAAMGTKSVDFIFGGFWNIEPAQLRSLGLETDYFEFKEFGVPNYYEMIILANDHTAQSEPEFINRFQRALQKSIDFCKTHPTEAFQAYLQRNPDKRKKTITWELESWEATYPLLADNQAVETEVIEPFYRWLVAEDFVSKPFDFQSLISQ